MTDRDAGPPREDDRAWRDRSDIQQVIFRYARGIDRLDFALVRGCFHADGFDSRPPLFHGPVDDFLRWVEPQLRGMVSTTHVVSNTLIELAGDRAETESYYLAVLRSARDGRLLEAFRGGRYVDSFSRRDGRWAIDTRRAVTDWSRIQDITDATAPAALAAFLSNQADDAAPLVAARSRDDCSYATLGAL